MVCLKIRDIVDMVKLGRFSFLFGGILLYILGLQIALVAGAEIGAIEAIFGYLVLGLGHLSVSYSNDYFDYVSDCFGEPTAVSGGSGVLQRRPELRRWALISSVSLIFLSIISGIIFYVFYSPGIAFLGLVVFGNLLGWFYSAPPLKLSYRRSGEVATAFAVGILVAFYGYYVAAHTIGVEMLIFAPPLLLSGIVFILDVQLPDIESDRKSGKDTLVSRIGGKTGLKAIIFLTLAITVYYISLVFLEPIEWRIDFLLVALFSLIPLTTATILFFGTKRGGDMNMFSSGVLGSIFALVIFLNIYLFLL